MEMKNKKILHEYFLRDETGLFLNRKLYHIKKGMYIFGKKELGGKRIKIELFPPGNLESTIKRLPFKFRKFKNIPIKYFKGNEKKINEGNKEFALYATERDVKIWM